MFRILLSIAAALLISNSAFAELPSLKIKTLEGKEFNLDTYKGKVLLIANTASLCGFTPQYKDLETLHQRYKDLGLVVLGFPSNDFGDTEPGNADEIRKVCKIKYGVTFPIMQKLSVSGKEIQPTYKYLIESNSDLKGEVEWNFEKFIVGKDGNVTARFGSFINPVSKKITKEIEKELKK